LVALAPLLQRLSVSGCERITNIACEPLSSLRKLTTLSLVGTSIDLRGLRRLARVEQFVRALALAVPNDTCVSYFDGK
jgi:hypothetical protein